MSSPFMPFDVGLFDTFIPASPVNTPKPVSSGFDSFLFDEPSSPDPAIDIEAALRALKPAPIKGKVNIPKLAPEIPKGTKFPYISQHCANGGHQGAVSLSYKGSLMPSCKGRYVWAYSKAVCTCTCHVKFFTSDDVGSIALASVDSHTPPIGSPAYEAARTAETGDPVGVDPSESPYDRLLHPDVGLSPQLVNLIRVNIKGLEPLPVGEHNRRRGELEANVEAICRLWLDKKMPWDLLTTDVVGLMVDANNPVSAGAVYAVFSRWEGANYAIIEKSPVRFVCFTPAVQEYGIAAVRKIDQRKERNRSKGFF